MPTAAEEGTNPYVICLRNCQPYEDCPTWRAVAPNLSPLQCEHWPQGVKPERRPASDQSRERYRASLERWGRRQARPRAVPRSVEEWNPLRLAVATFLTVGAVVTLLVWAGGML